MYKYRTFSVVFISFLLLNIMLPFGVEGCKDLMACGESTEGDYNLLLKVRDPSRAGLQVLCIVPEGYEYTYHYPWTGKSMNSIAQHKYIGVASKDDVIPNIVKAGMALTRTGLAFGDADSNSNWVNPTKNAWDDFDWIRYACEKADDIDEAVSLLTEDAVDKMHATGVSENLFIVGPTGGYIIEADAFRYDIKKINDGVGIMSNYPKELWKTQIHKRLPIAPSFDLEKESYIQKGEVLRLNSLFGVKIVNIDEDSVVVRQVPFFKFIYKTIKIVGNKVEIKLGERETVGDYSVELLNISGKQAKIRLCYKFKAWEDEMIKHVNSKYGAITVKDMINWSRLRSKDLDGLRPMCEDRYEDEAVAIYKIPGENYEVLSSGWFSANLACSSIYVPFHICDNDIFDPYETGDAAALSLELFNIYGADNLTCFSSAEEVFIYETDVLEEIATKLIGGEEDVSEFLTIFDTNVQLQAWLTEQIWIEINKIHDQNDKEKIIDLIDGIWEKNYSTSLDIMEHALSDLKNISGTSTIAQIIENITLSICGSRIDEATAIGRIDSEFKEEYEEGKQLINQGEYELGFNCLQNTFEHNDRSMKGLPSTDMNNREFEGRWEMVLPPYVLIVLLATAVIVIFLKRRAD